MDIVYKLCSSMVRCGEKIYTSYNVSSNFTSIKAQEAAGFCLHYKIGEITRPKIRNTAIFCLSTPSIKKVCAWRISEFVMYKCEAEIETNKVITLSPLNNLDDLIGATKDHLAEKPSTNINSEILFNFPNTVLCKWVKPIERVYFNVQ